MKSKVIIGLAGLAVVAGLGWQGSRFFESTVDWPLMVLAAKADSEKAMAETGSYANLPSASLRDMLAAKGVADRFSVDAPEKGLPTVTLTQMSLRSCLGLQGHPMLKENFIVTVDGGTCTDGAVLRFKVK